jgi:hypothetical protein
MNQPEAPKRPARSRSTTLLEGAALALTSSFTAAAAVIVHALAETAGRGTPPEFALAAPAT